MELLKENINNLITDDLDKRNQNWTTIEDSLESKADKTYVDNQDELKADKTDLALKADKTYVDSQDELKADKTYVDDSLELKADKTYVDSKVQTDVPSGAKFTDTITTINGKTGTITKADITALGIPAQDTVVDISGKADITYVDNQGELKADKTYVDSKVQTDVPSGAKFTDTVYTHPASHPASMITESSTKRFVSDVEKDNWDSKAEISDIPTKVSELQNDSNYVTQSELGDAGLGDMVKVVYDTNNSGVVDNAEKVNGFTVETNVPSNAKFTDTVYSHPSSHPASMITESSTKRFVSDSEKSTWNSKSDTDTVTTINGKTGAISKADIVALGIPAQDTVVDISGKADKTYVDSQDELKADKTYVDDGLALKADITYVDDLYANGGGGSIDPSLLELKADITYVDSQDALKADKTEVTSLADKVPATKELVIVENKNEHYPIIMDNTGEILGRHLSRVWNGNSFVTGRSLGVGEEALSENTGDNSNGFGSYALRDNTGLNSNGFGCDSLSYNTGDNSNGFGYQSLRNNKGNNSNGFGSYSLRYNTGDSSNGFGRDSLSYNTGNNSNGFGYQSLRNNTGFGANGFGYQSLRNNTGFGANGFGNNSLQNNTGSNNTAVGHNSNSVYIENVSGSKTFNSSAINASWGEFTVPSHGLGANGSIAMIKYASTTGTPIGGISVGETYLIEIIDENSFYFYEEWISSAGTGTHTFTPMANYSNTTSLGANTVPNRSNQVVLGDASVDTIKMGGTTRTPASSTSEGVKGETCWDENYFYICVATNTWKRTPLRDSQSEKILESYSEKLVTLSGTSATIDLSLANVFTHSLTGNTTYSITNAVSGVAHSFTLIVNMDSIVRTLTFPASVKWQDGEIPDLTTASKTYILTFMTVDGGTTWFGMFGGEF